MSLKRSFSTLVALALTACADNSATRYTGSAMIESTPDSAAPLTLTLVSRTDTSFSGFIRLGVPIDMNGSVYAWFEESELHIYAVGSDRPDTLVWTSKISGNEIGGRFDFTGGPREGQGGTWRASLASGPPASPETLSSPASAPIPPFTALWPILLVIGGVVWLVRWSRRTPPFPPDESGISHPARGRTSVPLGGWLLFFAIVQSLALIKSLMGFGDFSHELRSGLAVGSIITGFQSLIVFELAVRVVQPAITVAALILIFRRSRMAPRFTFAAVAFAGAYAAIDLTLGGVMSGRMNGLVGNSTDQSASLQNLRQLLASFIWGAYWRTSKRVRATFGSAALDVTSLPDTPQLPEKTKSPRRIWKIAAAIVGAIAILFAVGLWVERTFPYSVPAGRNVRDVVAGRWSWKAEKDPCGPSAHTIVFSDSGRVMTITTPGSAGDTADMVTVYDVQRSTSSMIRGAIRGEKRLTGSGVPVVWDLVLTGPDGYRWHRTDWASTPWSYTAAITRCK